VNPLARFLDGNAWNAPKRPRSVLGLMMTANKGIASLALPERKRFQVRPVRIYAGTGDKNGVNFFLAIATIYQARCHGVTFGSASCLAFTRASAAHLQASRTMAPQPSGFMHLGSVFGRLVYGNCKTGAFFRSSVVMNHRLTA
jgi:hypothetical protein